VIRDLRQPRSEPTSPFTVTDTLALRLGALLAPLLSLAACQASGSLISDGGDGPGGGSSAGIDWGDPLYRTAQPGTEQVPGPEGLSASDALLSSPTVEDIDLLIPSDAWEDLVAAPREWARGAFSFRGVTVPNVGIHLKGRLGSFRPIDQKAAFRVGFDHYEQGRRFLDLESLTLNNMVQDWSKLHEHLGYALYAAAGVPAPRSGWAWLRVDDEPYGLYLLLEPVDDRFLRRWFEDPSGNLYEGLYGQDLVSADVPELELDEAGAITDRSDLQALVDAVQAERGPDWLPGVEAVLDLDAFLSMMAVDALLGHWDGYCYTSNNYRIYFEPGTSLATFIPWGIDQTFNGGFPVFDFGAVLPIRCRDDVECWERYRLRLWQLTDVWEDLGLEQLLEEKYALIRDEVHDDPMLEHSPWDFEGAVDDLRAVIEARPEQARAELFPEE
jgi:hypothetical protein